jgi:hypothetical protein
MGKSKAEITAFFSRKMAWLSKRCRDPFITDAQYRVLSSLIHDWLHNESDWCKPTDKKLGESCAKSDRTIRRLTHQLEKEGHIDKQKLLGPSQYVFVGLTDENEATPANLGQCECHGDKTTPANLGIKTGQVGYEDRPPVGRTEPSNLPSNLPTDIYSFALKNKEGIQGESSLPPEGPSSLTEAAEKLRRDPFIRDHCPADSLMVAAAAEVVEAGSGAAMARAAANENWKSKRSA